MLTETRPGVSTIVSVCLLVASVSIAGDAPVGAGDPWSGEVQTYGALRAMIHEGRIGAQVTLDRVLPDPDLYALGALADLSGEITIVRGEAHLSHPEDPDGMRTETRLESDAGAALLVTTVVPAWLELTTERAIAFDELDEAISALAVAAGMDVERRIPFLLEGTFDDLRWHVVDGRRLEGGGSSHEDHMAAAARARRDHASAVLIGFYSRHDQGVFTHMGSETHIHCVVDDPPSSGHVDHVVVPAGTTVRFPAVGTDVPEAAR